MISGVISSIYLARNAPRTSTAAWARHTPSANTVRSTAVRTRVQDTLTTATVCRATNELCKTILFFNKYLNYPAPVPAWAPRRARLTKSRARTRPGRTTAFVAEKMARNGSASARAAGLRAAQKLARPRRRLAHKRPLKTAYCTGRRLVYVPLVCGDLSAGLLNAWNKGLNSAVVRLFFCICGYPACASDCCAVNSV